MLEQSFKVLQTQHVSEKASLLESYYNHYVFKVAQNATRAQVKKAVEDIFAVKVEKVRIIKVLGKVKRGRYKVGRRSNWKKAIVQVKKGQTINLGVLS